MKIICNSCIHCMQLSYSTCDQCLSVALFVAFDTEMQGLPKQPPLELAVAHTSQCLKVMSKAGIGSCAFADVNDYLR